MRLKQKTVEEIIKYAKKYFGINVKVYLFGSRTEDYKKGGDIDLYIETNELIECESKIHFLRDIYKYVTTRKVDLIINTPQQKDIPIFHTAKKEGILLC